MNQPLTPEQQDAKIAAMQAALATAGHASDCACAVSRRPVPPPLFKGAVCRRMESRPGCCERCDWYLDPANAARYGNCDCYLATLSDDIERGKELLGAVEELSLWREFLNPGEELMAAIQRLKGESK